MSLWVDKYRPMSLDKLTIHEDLTKKMQGLAASEELPHLMFYGPSGAGKKTRIMALLRAIYGPGVGRVKLEHRTIKVNASKTVEISTLGSNFHIECNPSDAGNNDRFVIQEVIKEIASHGNLASGGFLGTGSGSSGSGSSSNESTASNRSFKVVILTEVDRLSKQAQAGLRRTMEKYSSVCRLILVCNAPSKIIEPLRSRCLGIRIPAPTVDVVADVLLETADKERIPCPRELAMKIAMHSERNLRRALLMLEAARVAQPALSPDQLVQLPDWELYIAKLARDILEEQSPSQLLKSRDMMYELLTNCIPADVILSTMTRELCKTAADDDLKHEIVYWGAYYEARIKPGTKEIFHLEAFVAKVMAVYKKWMVSMFD
jgi:replication factor C subunit 3/5